MSARMTAYDLLNRVSAAGWGDDITDALTEAIEAAVKEACAARELENVQLYGTIARLKQSRDAAILEERRDCANIADDAMRRATRGDDPQAVAEEIRNLILMRDQCATGDFENGEEKRS